MIRFGDGIPPAVAATDWTLEDAIEADDSHIRQIVTAAGANQAVERGR